MLIQINHTPAGRLTFSGHETFPLRYGWLKKGFDSIYISQANDIKHIFISNESISEFGVGKNMLASMKHWLTYCGLLRDNKLTDFAVKFFKDDGLDPWMESSTTMWLLHYYLSSNPSLMTYYWFFNKNNSINFDRQSLCNDIGEYCLKEGFNIPSVTTLKRDVECFIRLYARHHTISNNDQSIESPLSELELIWPLQKKGYFAPNRSDKKSITKSLFWFVILDFWRIHYPSQRSLSLESITYHPGSPGRIFLLNENSITNHIYNSIDDFLGEIVWTETSGLKQLTLDNQVELAALLIKVEENLINEYEA